MTLIEQIAIAGISIAVGAGVISVGIDANKAANTQIGLIQQMAEPNTQALAVGQALEMDNARKARLKIEREGRMGSL
jgi:hypothetical protein